MSSWVHLLLLAVLAAWLRSGVARGDALPAALVELVRNSPISSIEDLQLLLLTDTVDEQDESAAANGGHRLPRSLDAQPAQQALCKVRTEVVEVTRAMLDRSNANFLLWPPCVEVQRCSGCCNTKSLQCVPVITHTRYLQVLKIEYINKRPTYAKAVVSVVDHVECRCQLAPRLPASKKKSSRRQHSHLHRNQTFSQSPVQEQVKLHPKDELHQLEELKQNQRGHLEDLLEQHWSSRGDTFRQPGEGYSLAKEDTSRSGDAVFFAPHWVHNSTRLLGAEEQTEKQEDAERKDDKVSEDNKTFSTGDNVGLEATRELEDNVDGLEKTKGKDNTESTHIQTHIQQTKDDKSMFLKTHTRGLYQQVTENPREDALIERLGSRFQPTKEPNPEPRRRENETPEVERILQMEEEKLQAERKELLLLHKRLDQEKEVLRQQQNRREEEERLREEEAEDGRHHSVQTVTQKPEILTTTTRKPSAPTVPRLLLRPNHIKKRMKKNRKRISKAAMRAMLM
uniref:Platelet-derived growth factor subunit B n=1 Tax=Oryzias latipes TaxID=8090 RepID=A0A3P9KJK0_ORYLA